jgi:predicted outer membrane lipoprotein
MSGISINKFEILWFTFTLKYASDLYFGTILGLLFAGTLFSNFLFGIFSLVAFLFYWYKDYFPTIGYRIGVLYGLSMIVDPLVTIIESVIICPIEDDWQRDPFLMSIYFQNNSSSNFFGPVITFLIYLCIMSACAFKVYNYLVYIHMNGRILDTYNRINSLESAFMVPYDAEVGEKYLKWVIKKAHKYRTVEGETRKVAAAKYEEKRKGESFSHIAIYNEGKHRSLYRHFMKLPNGAIIELSTNRLNMYADDENN